MGKNMTTALGYAPVQETWGSGSLSDLIDGMLHEMHVDALPEWTGVPLGRLTTTYWHPDELDAAWRRWIEVNGHFNSIFLSRMWHRSYTAPRAVIGDHSTDQYDVDLRCAAGAHQEHRATLGLGKICQCMGGTLTQIICSVCSWHHIGTEHEAIEAWHDHAFPGWRELPVLPAALRGSMGGTRMTPKVEKWLEANYPESFRIPGAPIRTEREQFGTRHVPGYSPFGGYDLSIGTK